MKSLYVLWGFTASRMATYSTATAAKATVKPSLSYMITNTVIEKLLPSLTAVLNKLHIDL